MKTFFLSACFFGDIQDFLGPSQWRNLEKGAKGVLAPFSQVIWKIKPEIQEFKHMLDLT